MGLLQGRVEGDTFFVVDCFRLPVEGTETRVNAGEAANEYMIQYTELNELTRFSNSLVVGWYHSHPGYGCWLSGIDVATQALYQEHQDPFLAIVVDPLRTKQSGRVDIGAFRTYPEGVDNTTPNRSEEFGAHCARYYSLQISYEKSSDVEAIKQENWVQSLTQGSDTYRQRRIEALESLVQGNSIKECGCDHTSIRRKFIQQILR